MSPAFTLREVELPRRSSSRRQNSGVSLASTSSPGQMKQLSWSLLVCFLCLARFLRLGAGTGQLRSHQSRSPGVRAAAVPFSSRQLKDAAAAPPSQGREKLFDGQTKPSKPNKTELRSATECLGSEAWKMPTQRAQSSPLPWPCTHPAPCLEDTATISWA